MKRTMLALVALVALGLPAQAQDYLKMPSWKHWNLNLMSNDEQARITAGIKDGSLTSVEAAKLQERLNNINALKARMSRGGLNPNEQLKLDKELDGLAEAIYRESHDANVANKWMGSQPYGWAKSYKHSPYRVNARDGVPGAGLTTQEQRHLNKEATNLQESRERMAESGRGLTRKEERKLEKRQNRLNRDTRRDAND